VVPLGNGALLTGIGTWYRAAAPDDVMVVDDAAILAAMRLAHRALGVVLEPSGAAGLAALHAHRERFAGRTVATIPCGADVAVERYADRLQQRPEGRS
jgi:threonine dehydratase